MSGIDWRALSQVGISVLLFVLQLKFQLENWPIGLKFGLLLRKCMDTSSKHLVKHISSIFCIRCLAESFGQNQILCIVGSGGLCSRNHGILLSWILALCSQNPHNALARIFPSFVLTESQSLEHCAFFVFASGHKYNKIHECPHTKVFIHARDQHGKEKTSLILFIS